MTPITAVERCLSSLCALFGVATIGMLVSVLVDRYQRVYSQKLYLKDEIIDFDQYSDDDNNDNGMNYSNRRRSTRHFHCQFTGNLSILTNDLI